jgi:hypothetical protein
MMSDADEVTKVAKLHNFILIAESDYYKRIIRFPRWQERSDKPRRQLEMKTDNGSHGQQGPGSRPEVKQSVRTYRELQRQLHKDLLAQHPEWIEADGNCPTCDDYERRLAQLISIFTSQSKITSGKKATREKE